MRKIHDLALRFAAAAVLVAGLGACAFLPPPDPVPEPAPMLSDRPEPTPQKILAPPSPGLGPVPG